MLFILGLVLEKKGKLRETSPIWLNLTGLYHWSSELYRYMVGLALPATLVFGICARVAIEKSSDSVFNLNRLSLFNKTRHRICKRIYKTYKLLKTHYPQI
jgi:hypothetical protein